VGVKDSYPVKSGYFTTIILCSVKTVADKHKHAAYQVILTSSSDKLFIGVNKNDDDLE